jgi:hypothetical protein
MKIKVEPLTYQRLRLPTDPRERIAFCFAFGDHYNGENFDEALRFARFAVLYQKGMRLGPWAEDQDPA